MGANFYVGCHKCKELAFMLRGEEQFIMQPFFHKHYGCGKQNVQIIWDYFEEPYWLDTYEDITDRIQVKGKDWYEHGGN